jgi:hypothetical protein
MNKQQSNYFRMFISTQGFLDEQTAVWSAIPRIVSYKNDLDELIARIASKSEDAGALVGVSDRKNTVKSAIALKGSSLSGVLQAFALEQGDGDLAGKVKASKSDIMRMKEEELSGMIRLLTDTAEKHQSALADFGVGPEIVTELKTSVDEFQGLIGKPRSILNTRFVALDAIDQLFDEGNALLNNRMDNIMLMFRESNPDFYNGYERARTIVDI